MVIGIDYSIEGLVALSIKRNLCVILTFSMLSADDITLSFGSVRSGFLLQTRDNSMDTGDDVQVVSERASTREDIHLLGLFDSFFFLYLSSFTHCST